MFNLQNYITDLTEICSYDSGRGNIEGVRQMVEWFQPRFEALGFRTELKCVEGHDEAPVLFISNCAPEEEFDVLFISHLDTVFDTNDVKSWPVTVDADGIAHGPGVIDCKGGSLLVYYLLREMKEAGELNFRFTAAMNSDEEPGSNYSRCFFEELADKARYCLVFEPGRANDEFVGVRKGGAKYRVKAYGKGAHSGADFFAGANAIVELAKWVPELTSIISQETGTTLNVARIEGGKNDGQVPDYAELTFRLLYLESSAFDQLNEIFERMKTSPFDPRCRIEIEEIGMRRPPMYINDNSAHLFSALDEAGRQTGCSTEWVTTGGMSDGNWVAHHGVGVLDGCGPSGAGMHTKNEYLKTQSVEPRFNIMRRLLLNLFSEE